MLARGVLCRLATDASKTSTHDLARLLQRTILARNGLVFSRVSKAALLEYRRSYATAATTPRTRTKPTATVKKAVKKAAAKKPAPKKTAKRAPAKKAPAKKPAPKKKVAAKKKTAPKKAPVKRRVRKELTDEEKEKKVVREAKKAALRAPTARPLSAYNVFFSEAVKASGGKAVVETAKEAGPMFKTLTPAEKEHYNHLANEETARKQAEYTAWLKTYTPDQIRDANTARAVLRRTLKKNAKGRLPPYTLRLHDDRQVKRPTTGYMLFLGERTTSGDFKGIAVPDRTRLVSQEWKALSASEKKPYLDEGAENSATYKREATKTYSNKPAVQTAA
ncbi:hypothetical protein BDV95DRAFT_608653 [Massariosphaeria phaeospora]|uniref:HMG box domain-containing protein n=1 Tax=Massariosphaeria phaeospora TaxID=100035 RepID=A0A7C8IBA2_9PLEO|nr:hypothetical protein BDV95DRAFT_608653 [Massariosphaeria phaeospora]